MNSPIKVSSVDLENQQVKPATLDDLMQILGNNYHLGNVHPCHLQEWDYEAIIHKKFNSATFITNQKNILVFLAPIGLAGIPLSLFEINRRKAERITLAKLTKEQKDEVTKWGDIGGIDIESKIIIESINHSYMLYDFDFQLRGSHYSRLRRSVNRAESAGLKFKRAYKCHTKALLNLFDSWVEFIKSRGKKPRDIKERRRWLEIYPELQNYAVYFVTDSSGDMLAAGSVGITGISAYGDLKFVIPNQFHASEFLDYRIMKLLKRKRVRFYDNGHLDVKELEEDAGLVQYKQKFHPLTETPLYDLYITKFMETK